MTLSKRLIESLNQTIGRSYDYMAQTYTFKAWEEVGNKIIIATDSTPISVDTDGVDMFLSGLIDLSEYSNKPDIIRKDEIILTSVNNTTSNLLSQSLVNMVDEISKAKTPQEIRNVKMKATAMSNVTNALLGVAKLEIELIKANRVKK